MKGTIIKTESGWVVANIQATLDGPLLQSLPLHPDDVKQIDEWSKVFDNIEARVASSPEVEFEIIPCIPKDLEPTRGETLSFESIKYAKLIYDEDFKDWERASLEDYIDDDTIEECYEVPLEDEVLIELEDWNHTCGDGCCYTYGTNIYINGEQIEDEDGTNPHQLLKAVLTKLGYTNVKVEYK